MFRNVLSTVLLGALVCLLAGATGCRKKDELGGEDMIVPEELEGDIALSERFEDGTRVTAVRFENILFAYDSYRLSDSEVSKAERAAGYMRANPVVRLVTEGHCDERGSREYNMSLGEHRSLAVRAYLVGLGIEAARIQSRSYGEENPASAGHHEAVWRRNRRVEFVFYK
ncbi:MAG: OmpA family protein [Lentisphaerae bacterium]|nr:OmpA family protein [Lentisphaerota bacterium]